ncbi:hypothetical protein LA080_006851 [Diaporthe eres]|nr:hypothetical protein LA080_006851 [Diaporthe eres]
MSEAFCDDMKNSIIQQDEQKNSAVAASELRATSSAQPPRSSDLETTVSHVIVMIINLLAAQVLPTLPPPTPTFLITTPSLILQAKGAKSDNSAYWLELGKELPILQVFTPGDPSSQTPEPHPLCWEALSVAQSLLHRVGTMIFVA